MNALYPNTHIHEITMGAASRGWVCRVHFGHETHRQSTYEHHTIEGYGPPGWTGAIGAGAALLATLIRCAVFSWRVRNEGGVYNQDGDTAPERVADWVVSRIDKLAGSFRVI